MRENAFEKKSKKPRLKFNSRLGLIYRPLNNLAQDIKTHDGPGPLYFCTLIESQIKGVKNGRDQL